VLQKQKDVKNIPSVVAVQFSKLNLIGVNEKSARTFNVMFLRSVGYSNLRL
jgi:hypothetical protein